MVWTYYDPFRVSQIVAVRHGPFHHYSMIANKGFSKGEPQRLAVLLVLQLFCAAMCSPVNLDFVL